MKKLLPTLSAVLLTASLFLLETLSAQAPEKMSYQAVVRNEAGQLVTNTEIGMQISILQGTPEGTLVYSEVQTPTTNANGLVSIEIGGGAGFDTINWSAGLYFIKTGIAVEAPLTTYTIESTSQILSVPYALHAKTADSIIEAHWIKNGDSLYVTGHNIGIGLINPEEKLEVAGTVKATAFDGNGSLLSSVDAVTLNGLQSDDFITGKDYEKYDLENLINNASFELFSSGDNKTPDYWSLLGEEDDHTSIDRIEPGYFGSSAVKVTDASVNSSIALQQEIFSEGSLPSYLLNETITLSLWAKKDAASGISTGEIAINDGSARNVASLEDTENWHKISFTHTIASDASKLMVELWPTSLDPIEIASYHFDGIMLTIGPFTPSFSLNTLYQVSTAGYATKDMQNENITNLADPVNDQDAATKAYVDNILKALGLAPDNFEGLIFDIDGNTYTTIKIGDQTWMVENLKTTKFNDGTDIPLVTDGTAWGNLTTPGYCWYSNNQANGDTYGALYNGYTLEIGNLCPAGWHVPTDAEWTQLIDYLNGEPVAGGSLKEAGFTHWNYPNEGATNISGFTALPGGYRKYGGDFLYIGSRGYWWSATEYNTHTFWTRRMDYILTDVYRDFNDKELGFSVRCLRN